MWCPSSKVTLKPQESKTLVFLLGEKSSQEAAEILEHYKHPAETVEAEIQELRKEWEDRLTNLQVNTPSPEFNTMLNTWNAYNCYMTFIWSRAASFVYCGLRNGYGYRDTVQDIQGIIHLKPEMAAEKFVSCYQLKLTTVADFHL